MGSKQLPEVVATMKVMDEKQHVHLRLNTRKSMIGHLLGAAGAVEAVAIVQNNIIMFLYIITKAGDVGFSWSSGKSGEAEALGLHQGARINNWVVDQVWSDAMEIDLLFAKQFQELLELWPTILVMLCHEIEIHPKYPTFCNITGHSSLVELKYLAYETITT
ncbi:uncharacterized protein LOC122060076 isoform X1 [Macadamia integrifolia]|uniref:uncharacterized protein LOC122060076 isoform X1 n=1 Tax=Macadamia integrifolia TaxID=60698 RepID=UPI001C52B2B0|nr:uncharacterized protein LOC122060076 isoform X1 [Macadamia integrifolia]XP_042479177.1 uncharacterized protein LOC122060076 isoform X1 [Macadamia integrifolia]XP_042479178.1 uncharacterized protein LOC122060076 isoform X1 [Macadamia integrifolia]